MRRLCWIAVILVPLAVTAVHAGIDSRSGDDSRGHLDRTLPTKGGDANQYALQRFLQSGYGPVIASNDGHFHEKHLEKRKYGNAKSGDNAEENGNGDQEDENGQKNREDEQDEGGGGWDRVWDAPKLG